MVFCISIPQKLSIYLIIQNTCFFIFVVFVIPILAPISKVDGVYMLVGVLFIQIRNDIYSLSLSDCLLQASFACANNSTRSSHCHLYILHGC